MNIDDLTLGQIKQVKELVKCETVYTNNTTSSVHADALGRYVICRSRNEGVNAGKVILIEKGAVKLEDARRLHTHAPLDKNTAWYEGIAKTGISSDSRLSEAVDKIIDEDYSLTYCTKEAEESIRNAPSHSQS